MKKSKCSNCGADITYKQIMCHSTWTPIICQKCNVKLTFDTVDWFKKSSYILIPIISSSICQIIGWKNLTVMIVLLIAFIGGIIIFSIKMQNIKLVIKTRINSK